MSKILFVIDTLQTGGAEKSILEIASRFQRYRPVVCYLYPGDALKEAYEEKGIEVISLQIPGRYNFARAAQELRKTIAQVRPRIIHSTLFRADMVTRRLRKENRLPLVSSLVNNSYHASRFENAGIVMYMKLRFVQVLDSFTSRKVDLFISNSEAIKRSNSKALGIPLEKIKVIYRGRDLNYFKPQRGRVDSLIRQLGIENHKVVLNVSRLLDRKGQLDLIQAFANVAVAHSDAILLIAGEGPYRAVLQKEIHVLKLESRVRLLGNRTDIIELLNLADCFAFPSHYEGLPGALIEAMMAGVPVVASAIPENLECVGETSAILYPPGDVRELAEALKFILSSPSAMHNKIAQAKMLASEKFEIGAISARYEKLYDQLLNSL